MWAIKQTITSHEDSGLLGYYNPSTGQQLPAFQRSTVILQGQIVQILVDPKDESNILFQNVCTYLPINTVIIISYPVILNAIYGHATVVYCQYIIVISFDMSHFMYSQYHECFVIITSNCDMKVYAKIGRFTATS
jgi:hypothetical protein